MTVAIILALALLALIAVLFIRAALFVPAKFEASEPSQISLDEDAAAHTLAEMIKCKTVSSKDKSLEDEAEFEKFKKLLPKLFPEVYEASDYEEVGERAILLRWRGESSEAPTVLMAHYDVVSAEEKKWEKPAFDGIIENGVLWGRGAIDTKVTLNAILCAVKTLIREGFTPKRDIYMAFAGDEEIGGSGASDIVKLFKERNIEPGIVLDEGGAVVEKVFSGVKQPCALIGIAEKGMLNIEYSVEGGGGHASSPEPHTPVGKLSGACVRVERRPFKFRITSPAKSMFDTLARHSGFSYRLIFANLWFFSPILSIITRKSGGELNALVRTTVAFTQMEGSRGMNVIPPYAKMVSNHRIIPGETMESVTKRIRETVKDESVGIRVIDGMNPSRISSTECAAWELLAGCVSDSWRDAIVSPYLMLACSDSRHWGKICDRVYRFSPLTLSKEERGYIHGNNERLPVKTVAKAVEFYVRLIRKS